MNDSSELKEVASQESGFAPTDFTDGRQLGDWRSRYDRAAWKFIAFEGAYLFLLLSAIAGALLVVWLQIPANYWRLSSQDAATFTAYAYAWLGGTLGGVLFALKWLYHSVAKQVWHLDRALWRYLTPHISGGLAFAMVAVLASLASSEPNQTIDGPRALSVGFLVGFFSDNAIAKLAEVAETLLGPTRRHQPKETP